MFGKPKQRSSSQKAVGEDLAQVLPDHGIPWYKQSHLLFLNYCAVSMALLAAANGYDGTLMNGLMALPQWNEFMNHPSGARLGFINAIQPFSSALAYPLVAYFANRWGRKKGLLIGYVFLALGTLLQALSRNIPMFIVGRFFIGQPSAWWGGLGPLLITEIAYPTHRAFLTALYNCGWYVGSTVAAWATYGTRNDPSDWSWRIPSLLQLAIPLLVLPAVILVPESPRFLISKDRSAEAKSLLTRIHGGGDEHSPLVDFEMNEIRRALDSDVHNASSTSWADLFNTKGNRHRAFISITLGIFAQWNGVGVVSYYLAMVLRSVGITSITDQTLINGCLQIWNLFLSVGAAASIDPLGRRPLFLVSSIGMLISYICISALSGSFAIHGSSAVGVAVVPFLYIYYGFYDIAFTPLLVSYPAEIWSYELRARGIAITQLATYVAIFFNTFVNPIALESIGWKYYLVFAVILVVITVVVYFYYPETKGHTLEEMAVIFDGAEALQAAGGADDKFENKENSQHAERV